MTNALNALKDELERADLKNKSSNAIGPEKDFILNESIPPAVVQLDEIQALNGTTNQTFQPIEKSILKSKMKKIDGDSELRLEEITEQLVQLKLDEKPSDPKISSITGVSEQKHVTRENELEKVSESLTASKLTNTDEIIVHKNESFQQENESLKLENQRLLSSNSSLIKELELLNLQQNQTDERSENARRKLKSKVFEYEKKIEKLIKSNDESQKTNEKILKENVEMKEKLELEKLDGENQLNELTILIENQKKTISDVEMTNNSLEQCKKQLQCDKQLIETNYTKLIKSSNDQKELDENAKRKLKNKVSEYEQKIGTDSLRNFWSIFAGEKLHH